MSIQEKQQTSKNIVFAGTPDFAAYHLQALLDYNLKPSLVITQPDRIAGRGRKLKPSAVKIMAEKNKLSCFQPEKLNADAKTFLTNLPRPDLLIVVAYGLLLPPWLLNWAKLGAINVHASLLPRWRGAAPIQRAIEAGDSSSGICVMQMDSGLDSGAIWSKASVIIDKSMTAKQLQKKLQIIGTKTLIATLPAIFNKTQKPMPQATDGITYARKLNKTEAQICWAESPDIICRKIHAFNPVPVAFGNTSNGKRFRFYHAFSLFFNHNKAFGTVVSENKDGIIIACKDGGVCITKLQEIGKKTLAVKDFLNGNSLLEHFFI